MSKQWSGLLKEAFTDADNFGVTFPMDLDVKCKLTLLAAVFLIVRFNESVIPTEISYPFSRISCFLKTKETKGRRIETMERPFFAALMTVVLTTSCDFAIILENNFANSMI